MIKLRYYITVLLLTVLCTLQSVNAQFGFGTLTPIESPGSTTAATQTGTVSVPSTTQTVTQTVIPTTPVPTYTGIGNTSIECEIFFIDGTFTSNYTCLYFNQSYYNVSDNLLINTSTNTSLNVTDTLINGTFTYYNGSQHYVTYYNITTGVIYIPVKNLTFVNGTTNATIGAIEAALFNTSLYTATIATVIDTTVINNNTIVNETGPSNYTIGPNNTIIAPTTLPLIGVFNSSNTTNTTSNNATATPAITQVNQSSCVVYFSNGEFISNASCSNIRINQTVPYNSNTSLISGVFYPDYDLSQSGIASIYNISDTTLLYTNGSILDTGIIENIVETTNSTLSNNNSTNTTTLFTMINQTEPDATTPATTAPVTQINNTQCIVYFSTGEFISNSSCGEVLLNETNYNATSLVNGTYYIDNDVSSTGIPSVYNQSSTALSYTNGTVLSTGIIYTVIQTTNSTLSNSTTGTVNTTTVYTIVNQTGTIPVTAPPTTTPATTIAPIQQANASQCTIMFGTGEFISNQSCSNLQQNGTSTYDPNTSLLNGTYYANGDTTQPGTPAVYNESSTVLSYSNGTQIAVGTIYDITTYTNSTLVTNNNVTTNVTTTYTVTNETGPAPTTIISTTGMQTTLTPNTSAASYTNIPTTAPLTNISMTVSPTTVVVTQPIVIPTTAPLTNMSIATTAPITSVPPTSPLSSTSLPTTAPAAALDVVSPIPPLNTHNASTVNTTSLSSIIVVVPSTAPIVTTSAVLPTTAPLTTQSTQANNTSLNTTSTTAPNNTSTTNTTSTNNSTSTNTTQSSNSTTSSNTTNLTNSSIPVVTDVPQTVPPTNITGTNSSGTGVNGGAATGSTTGTETQSPSTPTPTPQFEPNVPTVVIPAVDNGVPANTSTNINQSSVVSPTTTANGMTVYELDSAQIIQLPNWPRLPDGTAAGCFYTADVCDAIVNAMAQQQAITNNATILAAVHQSDVRKSSGSSLTGSYFAVSSLLVSIYLL